MDLLSWGDLRSPFQREVSKPGCPVAIKKAMGLGQG